MRNSVAVSLPLTLLCVAISGIGLAKQTPHQKEESDKILIYARLTPIKNVKTKGSGDLTGYYDFYTHELFWKVAYQNLSSRVISARIHGPSHPGHNAPVIVPLMPPLSTPILGIVTVTGKKSSEVTGGYAYVVISTLDHPAGEIRGRIHRQK